MTEARYPSDYHMPPYDSLDSAEEFNPLLASCLADQITILYNYVYFYDGDNGGDIANYALQAVQFQAPITANSYELFPNLPYANSLNEKSAEKTAPSPAKIGPDTAYYGKVTMCRGVAQTLQPVALFIESMCFYPPELIYEYW